VTFMIRGIQKILLIGVLCFVLFGCSFLVKELYLSVPSIIPEEASGFAIELDATVSTAYPVPNPYDGTSADLTVQLTVSGTGSNRLYLNPATVVIEKGTSVGTFRVSAFDDGIPSNGADLIITARAVGYDEDSVTITITSP